ncbi:rhamnulokinase [candidate division KSB1 bacterium]|nr:rhamnulokinase [candidate division KSB1 bacterium]
MSKYLAVDLGASSGRAMLATLNNKLYLEEIYRFSNHPVQMLGHIYWDILYLFNEMKNGMRKTAAAGASKLESIGVDTWGVDFGLVGRNDVLLGNPYAYRDARTEGMMEKVFKMMPQKQLYGLTGIQFMQFNSVFQLYCMVRESHPVLARAERLLFMPDLLNFMLTGEKVSEYTIASTSQLLNAEKRQWEAEIFAKLSLPVDIMSPIVKPGTLIGPLLPELLRETGLVGTDVVAPACHDTACAVAAVPASGSSWAYLSSGTWSLMGIESREPIINELSLKNNFTNEGGVDNSIRFLRNIMGLWLLQGCIKSWQNEGHTLSYEKILSDAKKAQPFKCIINPDDALFMNPPDMPAAIQQYCKEQRQPTPQDTGEIVRCILESLALRYRAVIEKINEMLSKPIKKLHIVGGGCQNKLLNQFAANATGLEVIAGPVEATAIGNILVQALAKKNIANLAEGREIVKNSFPLARYQPQNPSEWQEIYEKYRSLMAI